MQFVFIRTPPALLHGTPPSFSLHSVVGPRVISGGGSGRGRSLTSLRFPKTHERRQVPNPRAAMSSKGKGRGAALEDDAMEVDESNEGTSPGGAVGQEETAQGGAAPAAAVTGDGGGQVGGGSSGEGESADGGDGVESAGKDGPHASPPSAESGPAGSTKRKLGNGGGGDGKGGSDGVVSTAIPKKNAKKVLKRPMCVVCLHEQDGVRPLFKTQCCKLFAQ